MQIRKSLLLSLWTTFCITTPGHTALNDIAVFAPGVDNGMTIQQQNDVANYLKDPARLPQTQVYNHVTQGELATWMNSRMSDGKSDVLLILDLAPEQIFDGSDNSLAETWMENGNMIIWTGSKPFDSFVDNGGLKSSGGELSTVLDLREANYSTPPVSPYQQQKHTSVSSNETGFHNYIPSLDLNYSTEYMLDYGAVLMTAQNVNNWDDAPNMVVDEVFSESSGTGLHTVKYLHQSDALVLTMRQTEDDRKGMGGQYAQFYSSNSVAINDVRKPVLYEFLSNWVARDINNIYVEAGATGGNGSEANPYGSIQAGINAADEFSRDRVLVKPGTYHETLTMKRSVKLISAGEDARINIIGHLDDFDNPELNYTYNTFAEVSAKKGLTRAESAIIDGTGTTQAAMIDIPKGATLGTWVDGFTIQHMPEVDTGVCGHPHTIEMRGSSPLLIDNIVQNNGSAGLTAMAVFNENNTCLNNDFSYSNVQFDAHPALINNIISASNGPNIAANFYAFPIIYHNESFNSGYFGDGLPESIIESPGIGISHGARPYVYNNVVYDSSWSGIGAKRGTNKETWTHKIDRGTSPWIVDNYIFNAGTANVVNGSAGIGALNTGSGDGHHLEDSNDIDFHFIHHNFISNSSGAAIACTYQADEDGTFFTVPKETVGFVYITENTGVNTGNAGIGIHGIFGAEWIQHNEFAENTRAGIGMKDGAIAGRIDNNFLHHNAMAGIGLKSGSAATYITNNTISHNTLAGIGSAGYNDDGTRNKTHIASIDHNTIEWNKAAGIGLTHAEVTQIRANEINYNALPGITIVEDSDVGDGTTGWMAENNLKANGRGDLQECYINTAGLVIADEGSTAFISGGIIEESGLVNVSIGEGTMVTMAGTTVRKNQELGPNIYIAGTADIQNCLLDEAATPGLAIGASGVLSLTDTIIQNSGTAGISIDGAIITTFSGNTISGNGAAGIASGSIGADLHIENSSITNNAVPGIVLQNLEYDVTISDSIISGNGIGGVRMDNSKGLDIENTIIHNFKGGVIVHDDTLEQAAVVNLSNCDLDHDESNLAMWGGTSLTVTDSALHGVEVHNTGTVSITGSTNNTWNIGVLLDAVGWAEVIDNHLGARWPLKLEGTPGNVVNNITEGESDGYVFNNTTVNFYHNTMYGGESAVKQNGVAANHGATVYAYNNIITGAQSGMRVMGGSVIHADNNMFWGCRREFFAWFPTDGTFHLGNNNLIDVDPEFVDRANGDFHLSATSPAIDAGDDEIEVADDMDGDFRPQGSSSDIGADEAI